MSEFSHATLAVTGAGGHLGRRTIELLLEQGAERVVALTRDPGKLADLASSRVEVRRASFDEAASLPAAFAGVDRLLIISTDSVGVAGERTAQHVRAIDAAEAAGVSHLIYTSVTSPYPDPTNLVADSHFWTEVRLATGKAGWSVLRNNQYTDYLIPGAQHAIATGTLFHAAGNGRRAFVTREDCAAAATGALLSGASGKIYDIGGPDAVSMNDLAALYSGLAGKPIVAQNLAGADLQAGYVAAGLPASLANVLTRFDTDTAKGYLGIVTSDVAELTGRPAQSAADFVAANRAALTA